MTLAQPHILDGYNSVTYLQPSSNMPPYQDQVLEGSNRIMPIPPS